jgi:uncharacterized protein (DUF1800 family)
MKLAGQSIGRLLVLMVALSGTFVLRGSDLFIDPPAPVLSVTSAPQKRISFTPYPSADVFRMLATPEIGGSWTEASGTFSNLTWTAVLDDTSFHRLEVLPLGSNALFAATVMSKLTYGPTPELIDRLNAGDVDAFIAEQLNPETIIERAPAAHTNIAFIESRFGGPTNIIVSGQQATSGPGTANILDLQAWLALRAVFADRQLLEVLTQFLENHFVTFASKCANFFVGTQFRDAYPQRAAAEFEWREVTRWRQALLSTNCTFYDLLRISAESPTMIIYLDTATSRAGRANDIPNENYSRELLELFTVGVDNGYDQADITDMAPCWTGWTIEMVHPTNAFNPFAPRSTVRLDPAGPNAFTNLYGVWAMNFKPNNHATYAKRIFDGKTVPARFGPPYTTKLYGNNATPGLYELNIPARTGTNGFQDGYDVIAHLANLPFTQEYVSVKLCRLFVHDEFSIGYDYTDPNLSEEGKLVKACMQAWEADNGKLRPVLATIFNSALFRGHGGNAHKVKTPLEFAASAIRAIRQSNNGSGLHGTWTAYTDGYGLIASGGRGRDAGISSALMRMGGMSLFNREEPDGYPESAAGWVDAGSLVERVRFISSLLKATTDLNKNDTNQFLLNNVTLPVQLMQARMANANDLRDAGKVADVFLGLLFPGEGRASLDYYRQVAIQFLDTADDGVTASAFSALTPSAAGGSAYDTRVRGMVAVLMSLQRFEEQ